MFMTKLSAESDDLDEFMQNYSGAKKKNKGKRWAHTQTLPLIKMLLWKRDESENAEGFHEKLQSK